MGIRGRINDHCCDDINITLSKASLLGPRYWDGEAVVSNPVIDLASIYESYYSEGKVKIYNDNDILIGKAFIKTIRLSGPDETGQTQLTIGFIGTGKTNIGRKL